MGTNVKQHTSFPIELISADRRIINHTASMCIAYTRTKPKEQQNEKILPSKNQACHASNADSASSKISNDSSSSSKMEPGDQSSASPTSTNHFPTVTKKRVSFASFEPDVVCHLTASSQMTEVERSHVHWQLQDYDFFRGTARIIATEVLKLTVTQPPSAHSYDAVLTRARQICATDNANEEKQDTDDNATPTHNSISSKYSNDEVCLPPNLFAALTHWTKAGHSRRGLEKFCVPHHMQTRPLERQAVVQAVLIAQDLLTQARQAGHKKEAETERFQIGTWEFSLSLPDDEILRMVSDRFTKTSRRFGTAMGHADAAAVGNYNHNPRTDWVYVSTLNLNLNPLI